MFNFFFILVKSISLSAIFNNDFNDNIFAINAAIGAVYTPQVGMKSTQIADDEYFKYSKTVCKAIENGTVFMVGSSGFSQHAQSLLADKSIPSFIINYDSQETGDLSLHMYPALETLSSIYYNLVQKLEWSTFTIFYEDDRELQKIARLLLMRSHNYKITVRHINTKSVQDCRSVLLEIKKTDATRFILAVPTDGLRNILTAAQQTGLMSDNHHYIVTSFDLHIIPLDEFQHTGANIIGLRLVKPDNVKKASLTWKKLSFYNDKLTTGVLKTDVALMYDAVFLFVKQTPWDKLQLQREKLNCSKNDAWINGELIYNSAKLANYEGLTGHIEFNTDGFRINFKVDLIKLADTGIKEIGSWDSKSGLNIKPNANDADVRNEHLTILVTEVRPFAILLPFAATLDKNDRYKGYAIDLIDKLADDLGFSYTLETTNNLKESSAVSTDGQPASETYAHQAGENNWTGIFEQIKNGTFDLAIGDIAITSEAQTTVDFSYPFMYSGISILYHKPETSINWFMCFEPFSKDAWINLGLLYVAISVVLLILGRINSDEWTNPDALQRETIVLENEFTLKNTFWCTIACLLRLDYNISPKTLSTRLVLGFWKIFTLVVICTYVANLTAIIDNVESIEYSISDYKDVLELTRKGVIEYGTIRGSSVQTLFEESNDPIYQKMSRYMEEHPGLWVKTLEDGVKKVLNSKYVLIADSAAIDYETAKNCQLGSARIVLNYKGLGIAMRKGSSYRQTIDVALLKLEENGYLQKLQNKWWINKTGMYCKDQELAYQVRINHHYIAGIFIILLGGMIAALLLAFSELVVSIRRRSIDKRLSFTNEFVKEIKFIFRFSNNKKTV